MPVDEAEGYRFNPFDLTKVWSHKDYPLIEVGKWTLNRNPQNFFVEIEQAAFEPSNVVPGIGFSPDKMLLGRVFSYADAHRYRIGTNYAELPPHRSRAAQVNSYSKEGAMRHYFNGPEVPVYAPNSYGGPHAIPSAPVTAVCGILMAAPSVLVISSTPRTTTSVRPARWSARCSTTPSGNAWRTTSLATPATV